MDKVEEKDGNKINVETAPEIIHPINQWAKYHSSWDWQIKVWSKIALAVKTMLPKHPDVQNEARWYFQKLNKYEQAVFQDKPEDGQKIVVEFIEWYNANTKNKNI